MIFQSTILNNFKEIQLHLLAATEIIFNALIRKSLIGNNVITNKQINK